MSADLQKICPHGHWLVQCETCKADNGCYVHLIPGERDARKSVSQEEVLAVGTKVHITAGFWNNEGIDTVITARQSEIIEGKAILRYKTTLRDPKHGIYYQRAELEVIE